MLIAMSCSVVLVSLTSGDAEVAFEEREGLISADEPGSCPDAIGSIAFHFGFDHRLQLVAVVAVFIAHVQILVGEGQSAPAGSYVQWKRHKQGEL